MQSQTTLVDVLGKFILLLFKWMEAIHASLENEEMQ
jgi:hypothetical protein